MIPSFLRWSLMVERTQSESQVPHPGTAHETSDASIRGVFAAGGALFSLLALVLLVLKGVLDFYLAREAEKKQALAPSVMREPQRPPPEPRLEGLEDLQARQSPTQELQALKDYGWVDQKAGIVRIPIDDAMEILVDRLPDRPMQHDEAKRSDEPRASNSGRTHRKKAP